MIRLVRYAMILLIGSVLVSGTTQNVESTELSLDQLVQHVLRCAPCQNPEDVVQIVWGEGVTEDLERQDLSQLVSATDCEIEEDIGNGQKAYIFYPPGGSGQWAGRPNYHFVKEHEKLRLIFESGSQAMYATFRPQINGRYEIEEGWRADFVGGISDDRVALAWGIRVWFWAGTQYLPAYTEYTIEEATDPSLLGTKRIWEEENRLLYETAPRTRTYVIQPGDTLWAICQQEDLDMADIISQNNILRPDVIYSGQILTLPLEN
jgi:hypothetical protein